MDIVRKNQIVLYFFSTSNHNRARQLADEVCIVLYFFSTSNHNSALSVVALQRIVLYFFSTSNHNKDLFINLCAELSYTSFLHQTTTKSSSTCPHTHCLILLFYIKPQQVGKTINFKDIVLYVFSTSNHNRDWWWSCATLLSYTSFLHQTTTWTCNPQGSLVLSYTSFLHQTTTYSLLFAHTQALAELTHIWSGYD